MCEGLLVLGHKLKPIDEHAHLALPASWPVLDVLWVGAAGATVGATGQGPSFCCILVCGRGTGRVSDRRQVKQGHKQ